MAASGSFKSSPASEGSAVFRPLFLQRICHSALTRRDKPSFSSLQPTVAGGRLSLEICG